MFDRQNMRKINAVILEISFWVLVILAAIVACSGCAQAIVEKPDGTRIKANVFGSTKLDKILYQRGDIYLEINKVEQTPDGVGEAAGATIGAAAKAAAGLK